MTDKEGSLKKISDKLDAINETLKKAFAESNEPKKNEDRDFQLQMLCLQLKYATIVSVMTILYSAAVAYLTAIITVNLNLDHPLNLTSLNIVLAVIFVSSIILSMVVVAYGIKHDISKLRNEKGN
jgi:hypothetical protein